MEMNYNSPQASAAVAGAQQTLQAGTIVASRFQVEGPLGQGGLGPLYRALDLESQKPVALRALAADLCQDESLLEQLRDRVRTASALQHKNITSVFGMGKEGDLRFIAMEFVEGRSLRTLVEKKQAARKTFSLKGAYNVVAHICNALTEAHKTTPHGLIGPGSVLINQVGRIKVCEFAVTLALPSGSNAVARLGDRYCISPEVEQSPQNAGTAADIYSLGVVLFELLTGAPLPAPGTLPSHVAPHLGPAVDEVVGRCLNPDPAARFQDARELKAAFYKAMQTGPETSDMDESGAIAAVSGEVAPQRSAAPARQTPQSEPQPAPRPAPQPAAPQPAPQAPQIAPQQAARQPLAVAPAPQPARPAPKPQQAVPQKAVNIQELLADAGEDQTEKWLIQKDRLDFGPFSLGDLKQQLFKQEFTGDDVVVDQETGERGRIRNHPMLRDFIIHLERHFETKRAGQAEVDRMQQDRRRRTVLVGIVAGCLAVLAAGGAITAYYLTKEPETRERIVYRERDNLGKLLKGIDITWKKEPADQAKKRRLKRRRRRPKGKGKGKGGDDVTYLGDATKQGGDALLSQRVVQGVMAKNFGKLKGCVVQAARRNPSLRRVAIDFGVRGTGRVSSVKVNGKRDGAFQSCVYARMKGIKFPSFDGQLTRATFSMNLQY